MTKSLPTACTTPRTALRRADTVATPRHTTLRFGALPALALLSAALAACTTPPGSGEDSPSQFVVHTSTGQGWRQESAPGTTARAVPPAPAAQPSRPARSRDPGRDVPPPASPSATTGATTMLNFVDADLQGVVRALAAFTGRNFVVDPRVRGPLTLISEAPVDADTAYSMLLAALRMQGFAVVQVDGVNRVVPEADAKLHGGPVGTGTGAMPAAGGELVTRVFPLRYENATALVPILRPMIAPNNTINAYPGNNTLVITDYADNLDRIARVIADIDTPDAFSTDVVPIRHGVALDVAALAAQLLDTRGSETAGRVVVVADPRSNSVLLRAGSPDTLELARNLIQRIDRPETGTGNLHVVYLRNAQATRLAEVLRGALGGHAQGGQPGLGDDLQGGLSTGMYDSATSPGTGGANTGPGGLGGARNTIGMTPAAAQGSLASLPGRTPAAQQGVSFTAGGATVQADPTTNTLIISAPPPLYRSLREIIDQLDQRRAQVLVESLIVEVSATDAAEFGIQWMLGAADVAGGGSSFIGGANLGGSGITASGVAGATTAIDALGQGLSLGVVKGTVDVLGRQVLNLNVLARALQSRGNSNILATPNLMTLDNEEASIMVGQTLPFVTGQYTTSGDGASNPFQTIAREDVGLSLRIRPQISEGNTVKLALYQEVSSVDEAATRVMNGVVTRKRALETEVLVDDGQIIVLGGLLEDRLFDNRQAVPLLGDLPVLGNLFRYDQRHREKTNLMVFLRPHIVRNARDSAGVTLDRYNYMRAAQANLPPLSTWLTKDVGMPPLPAFERNTESGLLDLREPPARPPAAEAHPEPATPPSRDAL
ncbi:MAG TPA: type II secretion system secretin GspD [Burkholderiaceae bacterium]|nr:type II secretion system secretin GspD [Burkholderiaceae bacterium]